MKDSPKMNNKKYIVYMHLFPNNKKYIGITCKIPSKRWNLNGSGYSLKTQPVMYAAIQKYGWENVKHIILEENLSFKEACIKEKELIKFYKTNCKKYGDDFGYNMTDGGDGTLGHVVSEKTKLKMSMARKGKYKGKYCYKSQSVICDGIEYDSITEFCISNNLNRQKVNAWLTGKHAMPLEWFNKGLNLKNNPKNFEVQQNPHSHKAIYNNKIYDSYSQLSKDLQVSTSLITMWKNGDRKIPQKVLNNGLKFL